MKLSLFSSLVAAILAMATTTDAAGCTLSGTYTSSAGLSSCDTITISSLSVPPGVTLDLTGVKDHATINFVGTTTFGVKLWPGPLVLLTGKNLKVTGSGTLDGQGASYWKKGQSVTRPVFFRLNHVDHSTLSGFTLKNSPFRTFSILSSTGTTLSGLTLDSSEGDGLAKNTDGFDLSRNNGVVIRDNVVKNQDDCLAMQSSVDTTFSGNSCTGGHGISIGSIGGDAVDVSDTVLGLTVSNNKVINSDNGLRIKTIVGLKGLVKNVTYTGNILTNVKHAIVMHSDYSKDKGGYTGEATSEVKITDITIDGLTGTATNLYDVVANPKAVTNWTWKGISVKAKAKGSCKGQPSTVTCA